MVMWPPERKLNTESFERIQRTRCITFRNFETHITMRDNLTLGKMSSKKNYSIQELCSWHGGEKVVLLAAFARYIKKK